MTIAQWNHELFIQEMAKYLRDGKVEKAVDDTYAALGELNLCETILFCTSLIGMKIAENVNDDVKKAVILKEIEPMVFDAMKKCGIMGRKNNG